MRRAIPKSVINGLRQLPLFSECAAWELELLAQIGTVINVDEGYVFTRQGRRGYEFFVILEGDADCVIDGDVAALFTAGEFFGEMGLVGQTARTAMVVARTPMRVLVIDCREFGAMMTATLAPAQRVVETLSERRSTQSIATPTARRAFCSSARLETPSL